MSLPMVLKTLTPDPFDICRKCAYGLRRGKEVLSTIREFKLRGADLGSASLLGPLNF